MKIRFEVVGRPVEFRWSNWTGGASLRVDGDVVRLQSPFNPLSHFSLSTIRQWRRTLYGRSVEITKRRPVSLGGYRPNLFTVTVDGVVVATAHGL